MILAQALSQIVDDQERAHCQVISPEALSQIETQCLNSLQGDSIWVSVVKAVFVLVFLLLSVLFAIWFERRVIARFQERPGPNVHGKFGLMQPIMDAMKLLFKEDISVRAADKLMYIAAPMIAVFCSLLIFAVIPFGPSTRIIGTDEITPLQLTDSPVAVLYILACAALGVYGIVLGGWSSGSTYPLMGSIRSTAQVISYELAMGLSLVTVFMVAGSMSMSEIVESQDSKWWVITLLPAFLLYVVSMIGETNRLPFDIPEAEGELVAGFMTEYSSMKFAWFFLAEYINMINVSAIASTLFLGGWKAPWGESWAGYEMLSSGIFPPIWLILKIWLFMGFFVWVRGTLLRFRYDQFMVFGWKFLIPAGLVWIAFYAIGVVVLDVMPGRSPDAFASWAWVVAVIGILWWLYTRAGDKEDDAPPKRSGAAKVIDPFAGGFPVPPRPGEKLPPSPRTGDTVDGSARPKRKGAKHD